MIELYKPKLEDLWFREKLMSDEDTMSYNRAWGGTILFPKEKWLEWYNYYINNNEYKRFYRYLLDKNTNKYVGEVSYRYDDSRKIYICSIIILAKYRGKGYGTQGLSLLFDSALKNGISVLYDDIAINNTALELFLKNGFCIETVNEEAIIVKKVL